MNDQTPSGQARKQRALPQSLTRDTITLRHGGTLYKIGIGKTHARTYVLALIQDLDIRIINAATGEILRELTLDPTRIYQPTGRPPGPTPGKRKAGPTIS